MPRLPARPTIKNAVKIGKGKILPISAGSGGTQPGDNIGKIAPWNQAYDEFCQRLKRMQS